MRDGVVARRRRPRAKEPARQPGDHAVVLGVDHGEGAEPAGGGQHVQELLVAEAQAIVGHVDLEGRDSLRDQARQVLAERLLGRIGQDQVERVVDDRLLGRPAVVVLDHGAELHAAVLRGERDDRRGAAEGGGHRARVEVVRAHDPGRGELVEVHVAVDAAGEDVEAAGVELPAARRQALAEGGDLPGIDADVGGEGLGGGDDRAAADDEVVGHDAGIIAPPRPTRWASAPWPSRAPPARPG